METYYETFGENGNVHYAWIYAVFGKKTGNEFTVKVMPRYFVDPKVSSYSQYEADWVSAAS